MDEVAGVFTDRKSQRWALTVLAAVSVVSFSDGLFRRADLLDSWRARTESPTPAVASVQVAAQQPPPTEAAPVYQVAEKAAVRSAPRVERAEPVMDSQSEAPAVAEAAPAADAAAVVESPAHAPTQDPAAVPVAPDLPAEAN